MAVGIIGDVHLDFDPVDVGMLDEQGYDLLLFVGDLAGYFHSGGLQVAELVARLHTPTYVIPGNHDAVHVGQMAAEVLNAPDSIIPILGLGQEKRSDQLRHALRPATLVGYSRHPVMIDGRSVDLIAARPHSAGGPSMAYRPFVRSRFGVEDLEASAERLCQLVDESPADEILFLAHNGPTGLGDRRDDIWGCDFKKEEGDFGDPDLRVAIDHAKSVGKRIHAVVAGHMHHELKGGGQRRWRHEEDGVLFVNAARVPRIFGDDDGRERRHHVRLGLGPGVAVAEEMLLSLDDADDAPVPAAREVTDSV